MEEMKDFENALMKHFSTIDIDKELLKKSSSLLMEMREKGFVVERLLKVGTPVAWGLVASTRIKVADFAKMQDILRNSMFRGLEVFPLGIINPEFLNVNVKIGQGIESRHELNVM